LVDAGCEQGVSVASARSSLAAGVHDPVPHRECRCFEAGVDVELREDALDMGSDRIGADPELTREAVACDSLDQQAENLTLSLGQLLGEQ